MRRITGETFIAQRNRQLNEAIAQIGGRVLGEMIFVPSPSEMADYLGLSRGVLYQGGTTYEEKLEGATALVVVHNGIVLANPDSLKTLV